MSKAIFTFSVTSKLNKTMNEDIRESIIGSKEMVKEIKKTLQQANRRAQNIEKSGVVSPAYQALVLEGREGYSKFSITGTTIDNESDWARAKYEYSKAIEYLNNPTSSATGAKQYVKYIANKYKIPQDVANRILQSATSTEFRDNSIPLMNYKSMIDTYMTDSKDKNDEMNENAEAYAQELEQNITDYANGVADAINKMTQDIADGLNNSVKIK